MLDFSANRCYNIGTKSENGQKKENTMKLLSIGSNAKTIKSDKGGEYLTAIMYMAPADTVEGINVCPTAELAGCKNACLYILENRRSRKDQLHCCINLSNDCDAKDCTTF